MTPPHPAEASLEAYLTRLSRGLWGLGSRRREVLEDVAAFLAEDLACRGPHDGDVQGWLEAEHGTPEAMARGFRFAAWRDRLLGGGMVVLPSLISLGWMYFMGLLLGVDRYTPGYFRFLADFPCLMLVIMVARRSWRRQGLVRRHLLAVLTGLTTGLLFCGFICGGRGFGMLEHGFYGAFFGWLLERSSRCLDLRKGLVEVLGFLGLMQVSMVAQAGWVTDWGPAAYHLVNGLGLELGIWMALRMVEGLRRSDFFLGAQEYSNIS